MERGEIRSSERKKVEIDKWLLHRLEARTNEVTQKIWKKVLTKKDRSI
jgi:hypothetical protein